MVSQSSALQQCFDEVADSAPMALERCLDHVVGVLQQAECTSVRADERMELGDAWRELLAHRAAWRQRYPQELRNAFRTAVDPRPRPQADAGQERRSLSELTLVDDAQIMQEIESSRLVRHVMPLVEQPVSELDALVSSAMGLGSVRPELNPVRPEVFAQTLRALIANSPVKAATGTLWMKYMAQPLGEELQQLYGRLVTQFKAANVQAAQYRSHGTPAAPAGRATAPGQAAPADTAAAAPAPNPYPAINGRQITHALLREFLGGSHEAGEALPASYYADAERELAQLRDAASRMPAAAPPAMPAGYRELPVVERPQLPVGIQSSLSPEVWGDYADSHERSLVHAKLRRDALRVAQVLGLELVRKVVNQVAQDPRLLAPVREAIVALEPSLLRLAMVDPRFFSEERHPGRLLMEAVAQRSFRYNDEFGTEFSAFFADVGRVFNGLNGAAIASVRPFEQALDGLEASWRELDRTEEEQRQQAVRAMRFAELRQQEAEQIAGELRSRPDLANVPEVVQDFLFGRWALVLAHARLTDTAHQIDPHGYRSLISDLLWSVKGEVTLKQPAQLFARVPALVASLRAGLASIGQEPEENEAFFQELMRLHHPVLRLRRAKSRRDARESGLMPLAAVHRIAERADEDDAPPVPERVAGQPWLSAHELDAFGFEETLPTDLAELGDDAGDPMAAPAAANVQALAQDDAAPADVPVGHQAQAPAVGLPAQPPDVEGIIAALAEGDWFDLYSKRRWLRAQLIWASGKGTLFMFVSQGGRPHSMTRRVCERLIRERFLRPVRRHGVVSRALDVLDREPDAAPATP